MKKLFGALCVLVLFAVALVAQQNATIPTMTSREYNGLKKDQVFVVMFSAPYCGPCHAAERTMMTALTKKYAQDKNVIIRKVDVENDVKPTNGMLLKDAWGITSLPTFVVAYNDTVMYSHIGYSALSAAAVQRELEEKINNLK
ncbi:thioredoxin family protein [Candidatus Avelusimicrobium fimicolum]|jgi:thiol-disulfide isomerase/thioredoxin|uniref:thioredoxin family protein n=1 Tax=Candidatus Avelusimicrobium fimicolum TaxID=3416216 RepID=UPI003D10615A